MDEKPSENPHRAPQAVPQRPAYLYKRGAIIGAVLGGLPYPLIIGYVYFDRLMGNRPPSINFGSFALQGIGMSVGCAILGAMIGAFVFRAARRWV
jgi:hypothetical protein